MGLQGKLESRSTVTTLSICCLILVIFSCKGYIKDGTRIKQPELNLVTVDRDSNFPSYRTSWQRHDASSVHAVYALIGYAGKRNTRIHTQTHNSHHSPSQNETYNSFTNTLQFVYTLSPLPPTPTIPIIQLLHAPYAPAPTPPIRFVGLFVGNIGLFFVKAF